MRFASRFVMSVALAAMAMPRPVASQPAGEPWLEVGAGPASAPNDLTGGHMSGIGVHGRVAAGIHTAPGYGLRVHALGALFPSHDDHIHTPGLGHPQPAALLLGGFGVSGIIGSPLGSGPGGPYLMGGGSYWATGHDFVESRSGWGWQAGAGWTTRLASGTVVFELSLYRAPGVGNPDETLWMLPLTLGWRF